MILNLKINKFIAIKVLASQVRLKTVLIHSGVYKIKTQVFA